MTDSEIMIAVRAGDIQAVGILYDRYHKRLYNYFLKMSFDRPVSEDLTQEVFYRVIRFRKTYKGSGSFTSWIYRIAYNSFCDHKKDAYTKRTGEGDFELMAGSDDVSRTVERDEHTELLQRALNELNPQERQVLILSAYQGLKYSEIAEIIGLTEGAVKSRAFRAMRSLKEKFRKITGERIS